MERTQRLLLVGWDSADWKLIRPLVAEGKMPTVAHLLQEGVSGNLSTLEPQLSPMLWTSIATGKHAYHHGVPGFTEVDEAGRVVPVSGATRCCKALWDILGEQGLTSHVVSWFATHGERPHGSLVSNLYLSWPHRKEDSPSAWPAPPRGTYWPEELGAFLNEARVSPWDIDPDEIIRLFVPEADKIDQTKDRRLWLLTQRLSEAFTAHSAVCWLLENRPDWNLTAVYYRALDEICHLFMPYHPPQMPGVKDEDFHYYQHVVTAAYRLHDLFLARLINLAGPEAAVVLVSDHGFHSDHLRPRFTPRVPAGITVWHRPQGIFCAKGPSFSRGSNVYGARLLDIVPTLLTWFGLPVGADMEGRVLVDAFAKKPEIHTIPSWEETGRSRPEPQHPAAEEQALLLEQMAALGYIDPVPPDADRAALETTRENDWNLARASMDGSRWEEALPRLESIFLLAPSRYDYAQMLALCQVRLGLYPEAQRTIETCCQTLGLQKAPERHLFFSNIAHEKGKAQEALVHLQAAAEARAGSPPTLFELDLRSRVELSLRQWKACTATAHQILELDPNNINALFALARCALRTRDPGKATDHALRAIGIQYGNPRGHFLLGVALLEQKQWEAAGRALTAALQLAPSNALAHRLLATVLQQVGQPEAAEGALAKARLLRMRNDAENAAKRTRLRAESTKRAEELRRIIAARRAKLEALQQAEEASSLPRDQEFVIVSGLPRSGTSLMMQMLKAGGLEPMTDGKRLPDEDNPEGYWEWEAIRKLPASPLLIEQAHGKAVKVIASLLSHLPAKHRYKVLFMTRPIREVIASQGAMLQRRGTSHRADPEHLVRLQQEQMDRTLHALRNHPRIDLLEISYPDLIGSPMTWSEKVVSFRGSDRLPHGPTPMAECIRPALYRNRV